MAIAHVSAQAQGIVDNEVQLHANQQLQAQQQQQYTESQVQQPRIEAKIRTDELASAIVAANTEVRAVAEEQMSKSTQVTDIKIAAILEQFEVQIRNNVKAHVRQVLNAHMEQVGAQIRLAIATQGQELRKLQREDLTAFQKPPLNLT